MKLLDQDWRVLVVPVWSAGGRPPGRHCRYTLAMKSLPSTPCVALVFILLARKSSALTKCSPVWFSLKVGAVDDSFLPFFFLHSL